MARPRIGITSWPRNVDLLGVQQPNDTVPRGYVRSVQRAGGLPLIVPVVDPADLAEYVATLDGIVVTGGADIEPGRYGAERAPETQEADAERDEMDLALWSVIEDTGLPALGVCRGLQALNVAHGGTLLQHVPAHRHTGERDAIGHTATVLPGTQLAKIMGEGEIEVTSLHHQAVDRVGDGLRVTATAADGIVEGIEVDDAPNVVAVQWHPELLRHRPEHLALFEDLVQRAGG